MADLPLRRSAIAPVSPYALGGAARSAFAGDNYVIAAVAIFFACAYAISLNEECRHWFLLPCAVCGILCGADVIAWMRRQYDTFDPKALVSLLMLHVTFICPILHMFSGRFFKYYLTQIPVSEWGPWFGMTGCLWAAGLVCLKVMHYITYANTRPAQSYWAVSDARFFTGMSWGLSISAIMTLVVLVQFRGLHKESEFVQEGGGAGANVSWILMLSDPLVLLVTIALSRALEGRNKRSILTVGLILATVVTVQFFTVGFRGSRSATVFTLANASLLVHYRLRKIHVGYVLVGFVLLLSFLYFYLFFKRLGSEGMRAFEGAEMRAYLAEKGGISFTGMLLGDMGRADVQAFLVYRLVEHGDEYDLRLGWTYIHALLKVVPKAIWDKPPGKREAGTDLSYGKGKFKKIGTVTFGSTKVYGLAGEGMLNFGLLGIPIAFGTYGAALGYYRRKLLTLLPGDSRLFFLPLVTVAFVKAPIGDADNIAFGFLKEGVLPILVVLYTTIRMRFPARA